MLELDPCLPPEWPRAEVSCTWGSTPYQVTMEGPPGTGRKVVEVLLDGETLGVVQRVPLVDDGGHHEVRVLLGGGRLTWGRTY